MQIDIPAASGGSSSSPKPSTDGWGPPAHEGVVSRSSGLRTVTNEHTGRSTQDQEYDAKGAHSKNRLRSVYICLVNKSMSVMAQSSRAGPWALLGVLLGALLLFGGVQLVLRASSVYGSQSKVGRAVA